MENWHLGPTNQSNKWESMQQLDGEGESKEWNQGATKTATIGSRKKHGMGKLNILNGCMSMHETVNLTTICNIAEDKGC